MIKGHGVIPDPTPLTRWVDAAAQDLVRLLHES